MAIGIPNNHGNTQISLIIDRNITDFSMKNMEYFWKKQQYFTSPDEKFSPPDGGGAILKNKN